MGRGDGKVEQFLLCDLNGGRGEVIKGRGQDNVACTPPEVKYR